MTCQRAPTPTSTGSDIASVLYYCEMYSVCVCVQVARAGRFGTKGLSVTFVSDETDAKILNSVQDRFEVNITVLPTEIDVSSYSEWLTH